jgi:hypothetical protein
MKRLRDVFSAATALLQVVLLLGVQLTDGAGIHRCPEHDGPVGHLAVQTSIHAHGSDGNHGATGGDHQGCTCLGSCHASMPALLAAAGHAVIPIDAVVVHAGLTLVSHLAQSPEHTLPYAVGPPLLA